MFKKLLYFFIAFVLISNTTRSQAPAYGFQPISGTYTAITGGTNVTLTYNGAANYDDGLATPANAIPIGFTFNYNGTNYTTIRPCSNGWATFGSTNLANNTDTWTGNLTSGPTNQRPLVAPLWEDLDMGANGAVSYALTGVSPARVLTIQWNGAKWDFNALSGVISFQVKLYETTNVIEFVYQQEAGTISPSADGASIGISATASGSNTFISLSGSGTNPTASYTTETTNILTKPANGQIYRFTPYCTASGTLTTGENITNVTYNAINNNSTSTAIYENFANISTLAQPAASLPVSVTFAPLNATDQVVIFIDFNHNGAFTDPGETVFTSASPATSGTVTGTISIPAFSANVLAGVTRMRVRLNNTAGSPSNAASCGTSQLGQVEDYTVDIEICNAAVVVTQPPNTTICNGGTGTISLSTTGTGLTYQWQVSTNGGTSFTNIFNGALYTGVNTNTLTIIGATLAMNGYQYRALMGGTCTAPNTPTNAAVLTINTPPVITTQPVITAVCEKGTASFTAAASGTSPTYQWQVSLDGGITYSNLNNATSATLTLSNLTNAMNGNRYRAIASVSSCSAVFSNGAILTVNALPTISIGVAPINSLRPGLTTILSAAATPAASSNIFTWYHDGVVVTGATANTLLLNLDVNGVGKYTALVTDAKGCTSALSNEVNIGDSSSRQVFIMPNPSRGIFQVRYYQSITQTPFYFARNRIMTIYDWQGRKIMQRAVSVGSPYAPINVNLTGESKGVYLIELRDYEGRLLVTGKAVIL